MLLGYSLTNQEGRTTMAVPVPRNKLIVNHGATGRLLRAMDTIHRG